MIKFKTHDKVRIIDELELIDYEHRKTGVIIAVDCPDCEADEFVIKLNNGGLKRFKEHQLIKID